jgi:hypothetical protein
MPIGNGGVNGGIGLSLVYASGDLIGGTVPGARNVISGNGSDSTGIQLNQADHITVQGNFIGTDVTGTRVLGQQGPGLAIFSSSANLIGGTTAEAKNVFSGNGTLARKSHNWIEQRSGESVRRLEITQPNESTTHRFF